MDYTAAFEISATGMSVEKLRLDTIARNLANANSLAAPGGRLYQPLRVIAEPRAPQPFQLQLGDAIRTLSLPAGVEVRGVEPQNVDPRRVHDPSHPAAGGDGYVDFPNVNPVSEMLALVQATRSYEANVRVLNAAKTMAMSALDIGRR